VWLEIAYAIIWFLVGLGALVVGNVLYPEASQTLADIGKTWFGVAVGATYAFWGLTRPGLAPDSAPAGG